MFFCFAFILIVFLSLLCLFFLSSWSLLPLLMPSATSDDVFPTPFSPSFHRPRSAYTSHKVHLCYDYPLPTRTRVWICKITKKMPYSEIYFSTALARSLFARCTQGDGKVQPRTWQGVGILFAYSNRPFEYGYTMPSLCEHYAKCGRRVWLRLTKTITKTITRKGTK